MPVIPGAGLFFYISAGAIRAPGLDRLPKSVDFHRAVPRSRRARIAHTGSTAGDLGRSKGRIMSQTSGLSIRRHTRERVELPVEFVVDETHRSQVRFSTRSTALNRHTIPGTATDLSRGGLGIECALFLPRMCSGEIRIFAPGAPGSEPRIVAHAKVRRVLLTGHDPNYLIGLAFVDPDPGLPELIDGLLAELDAAPEVTDA
jgi:hypothetical protein